MPAGTVVVGAGQAGFEMVESLRLGGYKDPITLVGDEPHLPYQRPPLSKGFVLDKVGMDEIALRPAAYYRDHHVDLITGTRVTAIDRPGRRIRTAQGADRSYDWLVLAVGARNRALGIEGADLDGVLYLRTLEESASLKARLAHTRNVVIIGGGFIGLEVAAVARTLGTSVTVLEMQPRLMARAVAPEISAFYQAFHEARGVTVLCECTVAGITGQQGRVHSVRLDDGRVFAADLVVVGIGVQPNTALAADTGLSVANGIVVDEFLQTSDPRIFAIGDCALHPNRFADAPIRLESVQNAADQARTVAATIAGTRTPYTAVPWFWTDQYEVRLQMAGLSQGYDHSVRRGDPATQKFSVFYFKQGRLVAADSVNRPADHIHVRRMLAANIPLSPEQAADESSDLKKIGSRSGPGTSATFAPARPD